MSTEQVSLESQESPLKAIRFAYGTDVGKRREENQDSLGVIESDSLKFFLVADGMGGVKGGALASNMAVAAVREVLSDKTQLTEAEICEALGEANARIFERGMEDSSLAGMGTTFVGLGFTGTDMYISSVGDSRAYRVRGTQIEQLTEDHTLVMELLRSGAISPEQAGNHPVSHMLTRSLGPTPSVEVDCWRCQDGPAAGDIYLLCSDGLYNLVGAEECLDLITNFSLDDAVQELIDLANLRGGTDNITVMLIKIDDNFPVKADAFVLDAASELGALDEAPDNSTLPGEVTTEAVLVGDNGLNGSYSTELKGSAAAIVGEQEVKPNVSIDEVKAKQDKEKEKETAKGGEKKASSGQDKKQRTREAKTTSSAQAKPAESTVAASTATMKGRAEQASEAKEEAAQKSFHSNWTMLAVGFIATAALFFFVGTFVHDMRESNRRTVRVSTAPLTSAAEVARVEGGLLGLDASTEREQSPVQGEARELRAPTGARTVSTNSGFGAPNYHGLPSEEIARIVKRKQTLRHTLSELNQKIDSFERPFSGKSGELLAESTRRIDELKSQLDAVRSEVDVATRRLSIWFGRRKRLDTTQIVNLSTEVAVTSNLVRDKKEAFERATWAYLKEAEILRYNPNDREQEAKVADLIRSRKARLDELFEEVKRAIDKEISEADAAITDLNLRRDKIESDLDNTRRDAEYVRVLTSGDASAKAAKRRELQREREISLAELSELNQLLPDADEGLVSLDAKSE